MIDNLKDVAIRLVLIVLTIAIFALALTTVIVLGDFIASITPNVVARSLNFGLHTLLAVFILFIMCRGLWVFSGTALKAYKEWRASCRNVSM